MSLAARDRLYQGRQDRGGLLARIWCGRSDHPCLAGYDNGFWFPITAPIRAVLVRPAEDQEHVFIVCEAVSNYYEQMTRSAWMPALAVINKRDAIT
jgi:hypothetical protein